VYKLRQSLLDSNNKKGQGLSITTVIVAIVVLVVLVVLVMIFTGYFGKIFTPAVQTCSSQGGVCKPAIECTSIFGGEAGDGETIDAECTGDGIVCCRLGQ
jgi:hypothetical protein